MAVTKTTSARYGAITSANASGSEGEPNFRYDRLRPLFFGGLNNDGSQDLTDYPDARRLIGKVPFLNGGLFEETYLDRRTDVTVPDAVIRSIFDDLFDRFNFTVMESTPFDIEVAVDPGNARQGVRGAGDRPPRQWVLLHAAPRCVIHVQGGAQGFSWKGCDNALSAEAAIANGS